MAAMSELITKYYTMDDGTLCSAEVKPVATWVTSIVNVFGLNGTAGPDDLEIGWSGIDVLDQGKPYLHTLSSIRDELRQAAKSKDALTTELVKEIVKSKPRTQDGAVEGNKHATVLDNFQSSVTALPEGDKLGKEIHALCDRFRDTDLWDLGVYLEDHDGQNKPALVRPVTKSLIAAREEKVERASQKQAEEDANQAEAAAKEKENEEKGRLSHAEMFKTEEFSEWDEDGVPTKEKDGKEINKSRARKLRKDWERQRRVHEAWKAGQGKSESLSYVKRCS